MDSLPRRNINEKTEWSGVYMSEYYSVGQSISSDPIPQASYPLQNFIYPPPNFSVPPPSITHNQPPPPSLPPPPPLPPPQPLRHHQHYQQSFCINQQYLSPPVPHSHQYIYNSNNHDGYNSYENYSQNSSLPLPPDTPTSISTHQHQHPHSHQHPPAVLSFPSPPPTSIASSLTPAQTSSSNLFPSYNLNDPSKKYFHRSGENYNNINENNGMNNWNTNLNTTSKKRGGNVNPLNPVNTSTWTNDYNQYGNNYKSLKNGSYSVNSKDYYRSVSNPRHINKNTNQSYKYNNYNKKYIKDSHERKYFPKKDNSLSNSTKYCDKLKPRSRSKSRSRDGLFSSYESDYSQIQKHGSSERETLLISYRKNYCSSSREIKRKMNELDIDKILENEKKIWIRTAPADLYYYRDENSPKIMRGTEKLNQLCEKFKITLIDRGQIARANHPPYDPSSKKTKTRLCKHKSEITCSSSSDSDDSLNNNDDDDDDEDGNDHTMEELMAKKQHPQRLHPEMWFNDPGEMNDGPLCRCSAKSRRSGIRHGIYAGEEIINRCDLNSNNADKLYHYRITISPPTNFLIKTPTIIKHDEHEFIFEGFSLLSHFPLVKLPTCKVIRFNIEYTILYIKEKLPENFTIKELDLYQEFLFKEILELMDFDLHSPENKKGCGQFHFMPRFVRDLPDKGQEILSMNQVLIYLIESNMLLIKPDDLDELISMPQYMWQNFADQVKGMIVTYPGKKPCSVRVDQLDRTPKDDEPPGVTSYPEIVHFGIRPPQLSYAGNTEYQKAWRDYVKFRHLLANMPKPSFDDKRKLESKENRLQELRTQSKMKRDVTVDISSEGFYRTGIMCDIVQHAMLIPVLVCHLRFHKSLDYLENTLSYKFKNRYLLQLALTHPSYRENFGTNPDHARNSLTNCGISQPEYGDRRIHYMNTRKRGINTLINIMSRFGARKETESSIAHNERLEFLGDAVVEFLTSIHLFHMFPDLEEGGLATYRAAIVQNQHLAVLAKKLNLEQYMLYAHGSDLCHDLELKHAMANCFEALMGSLFLDGGIDVADGIFGNTLFKSENDIISVWINYPKHPLQEQEPNGDRQWIPSFELLQKLTKFEQTIGIEFNHIRLLARAFTDRSIGYTNLTLGSNQRLEFLGDTVLQLIVSEYLYKHFPEHHEGHLSLLRSSLVNNKTQAVVCDDLGMIQYALYGNPKSELKTKDRADLLEAFLGALYVDKGLEYCHVFCNVCFFPRLQNFIMNQDWNDPKSKLQQCCLTLRTMDGGEPDIPIYKVIECKGPTNTRVYTVAVYFQGKRLAKASGHSIQEAEMNSAKEALEKSQDLFPQLDHQKRVIAKSMKMQQRPKYNLSEKSDDSDTSQPRKSRKSRYYPSSSDRNKNRDRNDSILELSKNRRTQNDSSDRENKGNKKKLTRKDKSIDDLSDSDNSSNYSSQNKYYSNKYKYKYTAEDGKNSSDYDI